MYEFRCSVAFSRWSNPFPIRCVNRELGYPILLVNEDGEYQVPEKDKDEVNIKFQAEEHVEKLVKDGYIHPSVYNGPGLSGIGVFAGACFKTGDVIGTYNGLVMTYEDAENLSEEEEHFLFVLNDGENGVALDGDYENANAMKYLNHSCEPNVIMREVFANGMWNVVIEALRDIQSHEELCHDFKLHTEDESKKDVLCLCKSKCCRKTLFAYHKW
uniref:SET domain-containing protein n=2 Tax=Aplanochytrium stocchinoi TaxID=215587 RepID=A0A7S3LN63_9STRA|mmetsp:Transcript_10585/g.12039  ORF Transcript_10585/g.12039 Transcript_10585/m.12039 type:complete len:215 (+) Transcript_10585:125-769(+)